MPEFPEVDLMCSWLDRELGLMGGTGALWQISDVEIVRDNGKYLPGNEIDLLRGCSIRWVRRRGKYMIFGLLEPGVILCHNAMSGYWDTESHPWTFDYVEGKRQATEGDVRVRMRVSKHGPDHGPDRILRFHDARLFGSLRRIEGHVTQIEPLGPEPIATEMTLRPHEQHTLRDDDLGAIRDANRRNRNLTIKEFLMDQRNIAGIGNIYSAEILHKAGVRPDRPAHDVSDLEILHISISIKSELRLAIARNVDYSGLHVYRRRQCSSCSALIEMVKIKGRSSYFCPDCQK